MRATVDDVHHRNRQILAGHAAEIAVQRNAGLLGCRTGYGHAHGQQRVGAKAFFVLGPIQINQRAIEKGLFRRIQPQHGLRDFGIDVLHSLEHTFAQITFFVAIAQLNGFATAGGGATGHRSTAHYARLQQHVAFNGRVTAAIENFAADNVNNCAHEDFL